MRKKILVGSILGLLMVFGSSEIFAAEIDKGTELFSDSTNSEGWSWESEKLFSDGGNFTAKDKNEESPEEIEGEENTVSAPWDPTIDLELNTEYNVINMETFDNTMNNGTMCYLFKTQIPENGRIRIEISDCTFKVIQNFLSLDGWGPSTFWKIGVDNYDSGWITVKPGELSGYIYTYDVDINREARFIIRYERQNEYLGESEENDTYDTATLIQPNQTYEGNYSKSGDKDIYKFHMDSPGRAEIVIQNENEKAEGVLYEEDENGNVYKIAEINKVKNVRLQAGNFFIDTCPSRQYSVRVGVEYESPDAFEQEKNNVRSQANEKQVNTWYTGNLNTPEDIDYFRFDIAKKSYLSMEFKVPRQLEPNIIGITLYDSQLNELQSAKNTANPYLCTKEKVYPAGTYYIRIEGGDFDKDYSFNLNQREVASRKNIAELSFSKISSMQYTGKNITPTPVIKDGDTVLKEGRDYTLSYNKNKNIGSAGIKITGIGNYTGTKIIKFNIVPKKVSLNSVKQSGNGKLKISWTKSSGAQGYEIYRYIKPNETYRKVKSISNVNTLNYTDSGLKNGTKYYYKIRAYKKVSGQTYYSAYSNIRYSTTTNAAPKIEGTYTFNSSNYGTVTLTIYKSGSTYYVRAYGRGGKMNTTEVLYKYGNGYKAFYDHKGGDVFISVSNVTSSGIKVNFPRISEFNGTYKRQ